MNREEYFKFHEAMTRRMNDITRAKNADYTGAAGDDPFANFNRVDSLGVCSTEQGFMVRMLDKYMRINSFVQKGFLNVKDESVEDTLLDLANYAILFLGYLESKKQSGEQLKSNEFHLNPLNKNPNCIKCGYEIHTHEFRFYNANDGIHEHYPHCPLHVTSKPIHTVGNE